MNVDRKSDNITVVLHGVNDIRLEQTPIPDTIGPHGKLILEKIVLFKLVFFQNQTEIFLLFLYDACRGSVRD